MKELLRILHDYATPISVLLTIIVALASIIAAIAAYRSANIAEKALNLNIPAYAIISKEGKILWQSNFGKYNLFVSKKPVEQKDINNIGSVYILKFDNVPDYFEISTQELAMREIIQISRKEYKVSFIEIMEGYGVAGAQKIKECDFKIQAFNYK